MALEYGEYAMRVFGEVPREEAALFLEWAAKAFPHARLTVEGEAPQGPPAGRGPSPRGVCGRRGETYWKSAPQIDWEVREGLYGLEGLEPSLRRALKRLASSPKPLLLLGEVGSGKDYAARLLYQGGLRPGAFLEVDCQTLSPKGAAFFFGHADSPLFRPGNTLYFKNLEAMSPPLRETLIDLLDSGYTLRQNKLLLSVSTTLADDAGKIAGEFFQRLGCQTFRLPSLRESPLWILHLAEGFLREEGGRPPLQASPQALELLAQSPWPGNYMQLSNVLERLQAGAQGTILPQDVEKALAQEELMAQQAKSSIPLDLSRPLEEIHREIARRVLRAKGGNRSQAAASLGIARSTLWRLLKKEGDAPGGGRPRETHEEGGTPFDETP